MATSVSAISPRLICAVQDNPEHMLAAAAAAKHAADAGAALARAAGRIARCAAGA